MSARKLGGEGFGCAQRAVGGRSWSIVLKPSQTLRRHTLAFASATVSATLTRNNESLLLNLGSLEQLLRTADRPAGRDSASRPSNAPNATVTESLPSQQAERALSTVQRLSVEISRLVTELDTELSAFLAANSAPTLSRQQQQHQQVQLPPSPSRTSSTSTSSGEGARGSAFDPLALAAPASAAAPAVLPPLLSSLSLPAAASSGAGGSGAGGAGGGVAAAVGAGAESRAERRRQNWRRGAAAAAAASSAAPIHEAKYKTSGSGSMTILMGSFSKDHILSAAEEQLLAAAAQDFMRLNDLTRLLSAVLRRPPSMAEMARSMNCEETALRVRLDAGNRARTLLAQKNYRLVVSIAKRMVRPAGGGGGGGAAGVPAAAGGTPALGDGGSSLDDAITVGMEALMVAIRKFKPEAGYRLSTYATWWIRQYVGKMVHAQAGVITMSQYQRVNLDRVRAVRAALRQRLPPGVTPSVDQIAEAAGLTPSQVVLAEGMERTFMAGARSFEAPLSGSDGGGGGGDRAQTVEDLVATEDDAELSDGSLSSLFLDSEDFAASASLASTVEGLLASLDRADCEALRREYGLAPAPGREEAGDGVGEAELGLAAAVAAAAEAAAAATGGSASSEGRKEAVGAPAVKPGAERLQLGGRRGRPSAARALRELRLSTADDPRLAEWLELQSSKVQYAARTPGYAKKSSS